MTGRAQERFDNWAETYDDSVQQASFFGPLHEMTLEEASQETRQPLSILDVGCGTGLFLRRAAAAFPGASLTGIDASSEMIKAAISAAPSGVDVKFEQAFAEALPLSDPSFDLAVTTSSFHHWADQQVGPAEVSRVLRPGGIFVLSNVLAAGLLGFPGVGWLVGRLDGGRFNSPRSLDRLLSRAGFVVARRLTAPHFAGAARVTVAHRSE